MDDWFNQEKQKMDQKHEAWQRQQDALAATNLKEARSRFLLESFERVFIETLKMTAPPEGCEEKQDRGEFDELIDRCLSAARKVVGEMKQLMNAEYEQYEQLMNKKGDTQDRKPPASSR